MRDACAESGPDGSGSTRYNAGPYSELYGVELTAYGQRPSSRRSPCIVQYSSVASQVPLRRFPHLGDRCVLRQVA